MADPQGAPLAGAVICCTSLEIADRDEIHHFAKTLGAEKCTFDLTADVTHLVIGNCTSAKYKYVAKHSRHVHVVVPEFVRALRTAWMAGQDICLDEYHDKYKAPAFYKLRISLTGFSDSAVRDSMVRIIDDNGADYCPDLDRTVTHLIAKQPSGKKFEGAASRGVIVVSEEWLHDSFTRGMILDESLYDVRSEPEKRGIGAYDRNNVPIKFAAGKRIRQDDTVADPQGRRKIRRTLSQKLSQAHDAIWADIKSIPVQKLEVSEWQDDESAQAPEIRQNNDAANTSEQGETSKHQGPFSGSTSYIHGFPSKKADEMQNVILSRGGLVLQSSQAIIQHNASECDSVFLITPHNIPDSKLPPIPPILENITRVTEWWIEECCFRNTRVSTLEDRFSQPFFNGQLPGFPNLIITSTSFRDYDLLHISQMLPLLGATYDQWLKPTTSAMICKPENPSADKLRFTREHNIPAITIEWLWASIDAGKALPFDDYQVGRPKEERDTPTYQTTDTMTLPSAILGKSHNSRPWKSENSKEGAQSNEPSVPQPESSIKHPTVQVQQETSTIMPLQELSQEKLNSPTRKSPTEQLQAKQQSESATLPKLNQSIPSISSIPQQPQTAASSAKSEILSMLVARSNARHLSHPVSDDASIPRRKRGALGRAASGGLANLVDDDVQSVAVVQSDALGSVGMQSSMVYSQVGYEDDEAKKRREKLLAELNVVGDAGDGDGEKDDGGNVGDGNKAPPSAKKGRTPAKRRGGRKRN